MGAIKYRHTLFGDVYEQPVPTGTLVVALAPDIACIDEQTDERIASTGRLTREVADERPPRKKT